MIGARDEGAAEPVGHHPLEDRSQPKSYKTILDQEIATGLHELRRPARGLFLSGLSAGLDIGFSLFVMAALLTMLGGVLDGAATRLLVAAAYPVGFVFVTLGRSELFTEHTTLATFPVLARQARLARLARLWGIVYAANLLGALAFALLAVWIGPRLGAIERPVFAVLAHELTDHTWYVILASGVLAGWLMGLLSWLLAASQDTISRILVTFLVTSAIGVAGLHHAIAGSVEVLAGVLTSPYLTVLDYLRFLLWATVGNAVGGVVFVAVVKFSHARENGDAEVGRGDTAQRS